jgi:hypothetical protein
VGTIAGGIAALRIIGQSSSPGWRPAMPVAGLNPGGRSDLGEVAYYITHLRDGAGPDPIASSSDAGI